MSKLPTAFHRRSLWYASAALLLIVFLCITLTTWAQPRGIEDGEVIKPAPPITPNISLATATRHDGNVVVQVSSTETRIRKTDPADENAKGWIICWTEQDPLILGKQIRAYKPSGEKLDEAAVLKALHKQTPVACFQRTHKSDPEKPDPFYAGVFRDDLVILVFEAKYWLRD